ncbi:nuclear transport factor 2 family protein [Asanoa sp. NPDC049518]|uniref:nuclear transport factor 2 family protein n=1 Tax=unclassified Asanoa TaxID=2685164 RepID=UPI0034299C39
MTVFGADPKRFVFDFFSSFGQAILHSDEDAAAIVDRFHTPDVVQVADGHRMDREKLIAHTRPIRKRRPSTRLEVHEAVAQADRIAARYTMHVEDRGRRFALDVHFFGRFAADGRMREAHMLTRSEPAS